MGHPLNPDPRPPAEHAGGGEAADPHAADPHAADPHAADPHAADPHAADPGGAERLGAGEFADAVAGFATGVVVLTVADGRDDIGTTVTSFVSVSVEPPTVLVGVAAGSYLGEVLHRRDAWAVTVLSARQRALAGRFAAAGRPSARLLIAAEPHHRGPLTGALVVDGGMAALECRTTRRIELEDHLLVLAEVLAADYVARDREPLIRVNRRYL